MNVACIPGRLGINASLVEAPTAVAVFPGDVVSMPPRWAERYYNLQRWTVMPSGGHCAPREEPERVGMTSGLFFRALSERAESHVDTSRRGISVVYADKRHAIYTERA